MGISQWIGIFSTVFFIVCSAIQLYVTRQMVNMEKNIMKAVEEKISEEIERVKGEMRREREEMRRSIERELDYRLKNGGHANK